MEKNKKFRNKKYIFPICAALAVILLAALPFVLDSMAEEGDSKASILSAAVEKKDISISVSAAGTLKGDEAVEIELPDGVRLKSYLVSNGSKVKAGDALAQVDKVSVIETISQVQETLKTIEEEMAALTTQNAEASITSPVGGTVKAVYAQAGDSVREVMLRHGALAVVSLDGLMAVDISCSESLAVGESLSVIFPDGSEKPATVKSVLDGMVTLTLADEGYDMGTRVQIKYGEKLLGSAELYLNSRWNATGFTGTVASVYRKAGDTVYAGSGLFYLSNTSYNADYELLADSHRDYEELMFELFLMYQDELIKAPVDGEISGISPDTVELLSANEGFKLSFLANAPDGNDAVSYTNYVGIVTESGVLMNPNAQYVDDYTQLYSVDVNVDNMTEEAALSVGAVYYFDGASWVGISASVGDILLFADDGSGGFVWAVYVCKGEVPEAPDEPDTPPNPDDTEEPDNGEGSENPDAPQGGFPQGGGGQMSMGGFTGGMMAEEEESDLFPLEGTVIMSLSPLDNMYISLSVDELDVLALSVGQKARISVDALPGQSFDGEVTEISLTGESRKYSVTVQLQRTEKMVEGMNASVTVTVAVGESLLSLPVEAVVDIGSRSYVYTGYDKSSGELQGMTEVQTGMSDGVNVEVDLPQGSLVWYEYYDTLPQQFPW